METLKQSYIILWYAWLPKNMQYESLDKELTSIGLRQENLESYRTYFARWRNEVISKWKRCLEGLIQMWHSLVVRPVWRWRSQHQKNKCLVRCNLDWNCGMLKEESTVQIPTLYILGCIVSPFHLQPTISIELIRAEIYTSVLQKVSLRHFSHILKNWLKCIYVFINVIYLINSILDKYIYL